MECKPHHPIPCMTGKSFFELIQVGGTGCSGSPIFKIDQLKNWKVMGVYVGERLNDRGQAFHMQSVKMQFVNGPLISLAIRLWL